MHPLPNNQITFFFINLCIVTLVCNDILYELSIYHLGYKKNIFDFKLRKYFKISQNAMKQAFV